MPVEDEAKDKPGKESALEKSASQVPGKIVGNIKYGASPLTKSLDYVLKDPALVRRYEQRELKAGEIVDEAVAYLDKQDLGRRARKRLERVRKYDKTEARISISGKTLKPADIAPMVEADKKGDYRLKVRVGKPTGQGYMHR